MIYLIFMASFIVAALVLAWLAYDLDSEGCKVLASLCVFLALASFRLYRGDECDARGGVLVGQGLACVAKEVLR